MSKRDRRYKVRMKRRQRLDKQRMKAEMKLQKLEEKEEKKRKKAVEKEERHRRKLEKKERKKRKKNGCRHRKPLLTVKWGVTVSAVYRIGGILRPFGFMISITSLPRMRIRTLSLKIGVISLITSIAPFISNCLLSTIRAA